MGRRSLEVYLAAEILQEFAMYPGNRHEGGIWETLVHGLEYLGASRSWSCLVISFLWASMFSGFGIILDRMGWKMKL